MTDSGFDKGGGASEHFSHISPFVSVLMPVRNEASFIRRSLRAVLAQEYPRDRIEIIVADGMSTDGTRVVVGALQQENAHLKMVDNAGLIVSKGLNAAISQARGEIIVRVDGHTVIAPDYVRQCVLALKRTEADNVGGRMTAVGEGLFGEAVALATSSRFGVGGARFHYSDAEGWVDTVYMGAWPRQVFQHIGLFDDELVRNQDDEFNYRIRETGGRIFLTPSIKSTYSNRTSPISLWRQYFQYGFWKVRVMQKHSRQMQLRQFAPPVFVASLMGFGPLALRSKMFRRLFTAIACSYVASNLSASAVIARSHGWKYLPMLPVAFATLHLSYGLGFLAGLLKFWNHWADRGTGNPAFAPQTQEQAAARFGSR